MLADERRVRDVESRPPQRAAHDRADPQARRRATRANWSWRFGLLFGAANLLLLGIGLAATNPRRASNWNLLFALLGFVVYYNLINLSQAWVASGRVGLGAALLGLHGAAFVLALALLWWRDHAAVVRLLPAGRGAAGGGRMKTVRRLLYRDIVSSVLFVALAFLSLFYFIDFVDELDDVGSRGRTVGTAVLAAAYELPGHFYELVPIAVLIGTHLRAVAHGAEQSEFTILRTGGLGPGPRAVAAGGAGRGLRRRHLRHRRLHRARGANARRDC